MINKENHTSRRLTELMGGSRVYTPRQLLIRADDTGCLKDRELLSSIAEHFESYCGLDGMLYHSAIIEVEVYEGHVPNDWDDYNGVRLWFDT